MRCKEKMSERGELGKRERSKREAGLLALRIKGLAETVAATGPAKARRLPSGSSSLIGSIPRRGILADLVSRDQSRLLSNRWERNQNQDGARVIEENKIRRNDCESREK